MIKLLLLAAPVLLVALSALPGYLIRRTARRGDAVAIEARHADRAPVAEAEPDELEEKWSAYWAASHRESLVLATRLTDYADSLDAVVDAFAADCARVVQRFVVDAVRVHHAHGNAFGGWSDDVERDADRWYARANGSPHTMSHLLAVEIAECTDTRWTDEDARMLREHIEAEQVSR